MERYELTPRGWDVVNDLRAQEFQRAAGTANVRVRVAAELAPEVPEPAEPEPEAPQPPPRLSPFKTPEGFVKKVTAGYEVYLLALANLQDKGISPTLVEWGREVARLKQESCKRCKKKIDPNCKRCEGTGIITSISGPGVGEQADLLVKMGLVRRMGSQRAIDLTEGGRRELTELSKFRGLEAYMDAPSIVSHLIEEGKITEQDVVDAVGAFDPEAKAKLVNLLREPEVPEPVD